MLPNHFVQKIYIDTQKNLLKTIVYSMYTILTHLYHSRYHRCTHPESMTMFHSIFAEGLKLLFQIQKFQNFPLYSPQTDCNWKQGVIRVLFISEMPVFTHPQSHKSRQSLQVPNLIGNQCIQDLQDNYKQYLRYYSALIQ